MANYNKAAEMGFDLQITFFKERMKDLKISQKKLADLIEINESTLIRNFKKETEMSHLTFLKICGALEINPYLVPKEMNNDEFQRIHFN
jgi:DNA-binding Xre family transcriptional regulator